MAGDASGNAYSTAEADVYQYPPVNNFNPLALNGTYLSGSFGNQLTSSAQFPTQSYIQVESNFQLSSFDDSSSTSITSVTETFMVSSVPEPTSMIPLGTGLIALGCYTWYRRRKPS